MTNADQPPGALVTSKFLVNGSPVELAAPSDETLLETLRNRLGFTSVRGVCGVGICGACTVLIDGAVMSSCTTLTAAADGRSVRTSEGLLNIDGSLSRVQQAFVSHAAYQCSFCIPGMTLAVDAAMRDPEVRHSTARVREYLSGNLCRCGSYPQILEAVEDLVNASSQDDDEIGGKSCG